MKDILFNIEDESTYYSVTAGALARALITKLLQDNKISEIELAEMLTKDFTKQFKKVVYPIVALRRDANRGTSKKYRYCKNPVKYNGKDIYISSEWFDESKDDLIKWYKSHY